jgi:hypothetical protein
LPRNQWQERKRYHQLLLPKPERKLLTNAERQRRWRARHRAPVTEPRSAREAQSNENRNDELHQECTEVALGKHRRYASSAREAQNGNSSINVTEPSSAREAHIHIYQEQGRDDGGEE